jgi:hypothetical protein
MIKESLDHKNVDRVGLHIKCFKAAELLVMSLLIALILLEGGSYTLRSLLLSADPAPEHYRLVQKNWSEDTAKFLTEFDDSRAGLIEYQVYEPFIGWRSNKTAGQMLNIDNEGNRITDNSTNTSSTATTVDFYGGSTMWGYGVSDANTVPSRFARLSNTILARNFGEVAYNSRQELNYFLNNVVRGRIGNVVVFFDGINDVDADCDSANDPFGDFETGTIRSVLALIGPGGRIRNLATGLGIRNKIALILPNTTALVERLTGRQFGREVDFHVKNSTDICGDPEIANLVAENLVRNWEAASLIANRHNATFFAILQPHPDVAEMPYSTHWFDEIKQAVYPLIKAKAERFSWFIDGTRWLNGRTDVYIDNCCHLNEKGNELIAEHIFREVNGR